MGAGLQKCFFQPFGPHFGLKIRGGGRVPRASPLDPPLYHDIRFPVVGIDPGLVVYGVGQVSMQMHGTSREILGLS